jgi:hypothetical protein
VQFNAASFTIAESAGSTNITVTRVGDASAAATVDYATSNGTASERTDFTAIRGTLRFAPGDTSKTFTLLINDDVFVESNETINLTLSNATGGASLGNPSTAVLTITDNETVQPISNPIDTAPYFVERQYNDFFNRVADEGGRSFWVNNLNSLIADCNSRPEGEERRKCVLGARAQVSTAFFLSIEFQQTGYFVIRFYVESFGRLPRLEEFLQDTQEVGRGVVVGATGWEALLESNTQAFATDWTLRADFKSRYDAVSNADYVNALFTNAGVGVNEEQALRTSLIIGLNSAPATETRANVLRKVAESRAVYNQQYNPAFVLMQYFGYLRRDPDASGFNFWLTKMNEFTLPGEDAQNPNVSLARVKRAQMVEAFVDSGEYRQRFGP